MSMEQKTILFVEVDDDTRPIIKANLQASGYRVAVALDEEDALERTKGGRLRPDLILIDLNAPPHEVLDVARHIRRQAELSDATPIIVISCEYPTESVGKDVAVTATEYITYLGEENPLRELIGRLLRTKARPKEHRVEQTGAYPP
jgi:DNA-binding response OmpR family regulator